MGKFTTKLDGYACIRCHHRWRPHATTVGRPKTCPRCRTAYWDRERQRPAPKRP